MGDFIHEIVDVDDDILKKISQLIKQEEDLINTLKEGSYKPYYLSRILAFTPFIRAIDPLGEDYSDSLASEWYDAKYFGGNYPKTPYEFNTVCSQYLGVLNSLLLTGKARIVKEKRKREKNNTSSATSKCIFHKRDLPMQDNFVFVIMPFTEPWSDYIWKREIKPIVQAIDEYQLICKRADDLFGQDVMQEIYESIMTASIVIADITNLNPNVFYELGIAHALGKDIILLAQNADHIPFDLKRFRHCIYSNDGPGYDNLRKYIPSAIKDMLSKR